MPHRAMLVTTALNAKGSDLDLLDSQSAQITAATTLLDLGDALGIVGDPLEVLGDLDGVLPAAIIQSVLAGFRGAVAAPQVDAVQTVWNASGGFHAQVSHGTSAADSGIVTIVVRTPADLLGGVA